MLNFRRALFVVLLGAACSWALVGACNKPAPPPPSSQGMPPLDPLDTPPTAKTHAEHAAVDPSAPAMPPGHPALPSANPHAQMGQPVGQQDQQLEALTPGDIPYDAKTVIAGQIKLADKVKDKVKTGDVIYLVARRPGEGGAPGAVVAVRKLEAGSFPMSFQLDSRDAMMAGTQMQGPLVLTARVDKDGDAMTKNPGDVTGTLQLKSLPAAKAALVLDTVL
jgi:hypothetical protein